MKTPPNPFAILGLAIALPGMGQVANKQPMRGLTFLFFILLLGAFTLKTAGPEISMLGKLSGGVFVWALSILDAYKTARIKKRDLAANAERAT